MSEISKHSPRLLLSPEDKADNLAFEYKKKAALLSKLQTESANLEKIISAPSLELRIQALEEEIAEVDSKCYFEEQYTKVLQNMNKRTLSSNRDYKVKVEMLQRQEQSILKRIGTGNEVIIEAVSNTQERKNKVKHMKNTLALSRANKKEAILAHLKSAKIAAEHLYSTYKVNELSQNGINEEEKRSLDWHRELLKKLTKVSVSTEMRKKEIDENLENLMSLFKTLGMPDLSDCVTEYEKVVITNNSLSKKTDILLKEIHSIQESIKITAKPNFAPTRKSNEKPQVSLPISISEESKQSSLVVLIYQLFKDLNLKLDRVLDLKANEINMATTSIRNTASIISQLGKRLLKLEKLAMKKLAKNFEKWLDKIETSNAHIYIKVKEPRVNIKEIESEIIYSENKRYIVDMLDSAMQVENKAKQVMKSKRKTERERTPLEGIDLENLEESSGEKESISKKQYNSKHDYRVSGQFEKKFDSSIKRVSSQTLNFRKKKLNELKKFKFYNQEIAANRIFSNTPKSTEIGSSQNKVNNGKFPKLHLLYQATSPQTARRPGSKHSYTAENFATLKKIFRL